MNLETALAEIDWLVPQRVRQLERFGLRSVEDLLTHFQNATKIARVSTVFPRAKPPGRFVFADL